MRRGILLQEDAQEYQQLHMLNLFQSIELSICLTKERKYSIQSFFKILLAVLQVTNLLLGHASFDSIIPASALFPVSNSIAMILGTCWKHRM